MNNEETIEVLRTYLPKYLTPEPLEKLISNIKEDFPHSGKSEIMYIQIDDSLFYQGDALIDLPYAAFEKGKFEAVNINGILATNTCDISTENQRLEPFDIQFFVIYSLNEYTTHLRKVGKSEDRIDSFKSSLKSNKVTNLLYLPELKLSDKIILEESFVRFDKTSSIPISTLDSRTFNKKYQPYGDRLFTLSNYGFYLFLTKLSIHYCRFKEGVFRNN